MTERKLSEIGIVINSNIILLSPEERRELVRESIYWFIMEHIESYRASDALGVCMEKFFKEQGI